MVLPAELHVDEVKDAEALQDMTAISQVLPTEISNPVYLISILTPRPETLNLHV